MPHDFDTDELMRSLDEYIEAKMEHDKQRADCDRSWGYFGSRYIDRLDEAKKGVREALNKIIAAEVRSPTPPKEPA